MGQMIVWFNVGAAYIEHWLPWFNIQNYLFFVLMYVASLFYICFLLNLFRLFVHYVGLMHHKRVLFWFQTFWLLYISSYSNVSFFVRRKLFWSRICFLHFVVLSKFHTDCNIVGVWILLRNDRYFNNIYFKIQIYKSDL